MGPGAKCMLVEQTSSYVPPQQTWIHGKDNKITTTINPNECMTFDDDGNVFMNACINAEKWKHRASTNQIQNMGGTKCLAMKKLGSVQANHRITPGKKPAGRPKPLTDQTFLFMEPCNNAKQEQMWSFG